LLDPVAHNKNVSPSTGFAAAPDLGKHPRSVGQCSTSNQLCWYAPKVK